MTDFQTIQGNIKKIIDTGRGRKDILRYLKTEGWTEQQYKSSFRGITEEQARAAGAVPGVALTDEQIQAIRQGQQIQQEPSIGQPRGTIAQKLGFPETEPFQSRPVEQPGTRGESFVHGLIYDPTALGLGAASLISNDPNIGTAIAAEGAKNEEIAKDFPLTNLVGQIVGEIGATATLGPTKGMGSAMRIGAAAGASGVLGALGAAGRGQDPITAGITGLGIGAGIGALSEVGQKLITKYINSRNGVFTSEDIKDILKIAYREGIPVFVDDLLPPGVRRNLGMIAETTRRIKQNKAQQAAAQRLMDDFLEGFGDLHEEVKMSMVRQLGRNKFESRRLFDKAAADLDPLGPMNMSKVRNVAQQWVNELKTVQRSLMKNGSETPASKSIQGLIDEVDGFTGTGDDIFSNVRSVRDYLSSRLREVEGTPASRPIQALKNAFDESLETFGSGTGRTVPVHETYRQALKFYRDTVVPFKKGRLKSFVTDANPEDIVALLHRHAGRGKQGSTATANKVWNALDERGRRAVQGAIVEEAFNRATVGREGFSPKLFNSELENIQKVTNVFFKGRDRSRIEGLKRVFSATKRAGQVAENPPTGNRIISALQTGGLVGGLTVATVQTLKTGASLLGTGLGIRTLYQSPSIRNYLFALGRATPGTERYANLMFKIGETARRIESSRAESKKNLTKEFLEK